MDNSKKLDSKTNETIEKIKGNKNVFQLVLFVAFSSIAAIAQLGSRVIIDLLLKDLTQTVEIWPFGKQALGSFIAFLVSNIIAKVISYVTNRKTTFKATNNAVSSAIIYTVMVVTLIIVETIIGTPLQNGLYGLLGGEFSGTEMTTSSALSPSLYQLCGVGAQAIYGFFDGIIVFLMDKYVIMRSDKPDDSADSTGKSGTDSDTPSGK